MKNVHEKLMEKWEGSDAQKECHIEMIEACGSKDWRVYEHHIKAKFEKFLRKSVKGEKCHIL